MNTELLDKKIFDSFGYYCPTMSIDSDEAFFSFELLGEPKTIRKTKNGFKLFENRCLHRGSLIDDYGFGNKKFFCGYHGWSYSSDGILIENALNGRCKNRELRADNLSGNSGIISKEKSGPPLSKLSDIFPLDFLDTKPLYFDAIDHESNWRLLVENVLESYHLNSVHKETFLKEGYRSNKNYELEIYDDFSLSKQLSDKNSINSGGSFYDHAFVYPNLSLSNTNNLIYFVSFLIPKNKNETKLKWFLFGSSKFFKLKKTEQKVILFNAKKFTSKALLEDKEVVERCYKGFKGSQKTYQLVEGEERVSSFHEWIKKI